MNYRCIECKCISIIVQNHSPANTGIEFKSWSEITDLAQKFADQLMLEDPELTPDSALIKARKLPMVKKAEEEFGKKKTYYICSNRHEFYSYPNN
jgi:hypothetical protein